MKGIRIGRKMRQLTLLLGALSLTGAAFAGPHAGAPAGPPGGFPGAGPHRGPDPARMLEHMTAELDLTAEQREAIRQQLESRGDEIRALHEELRANHREMRELDPADPNYQTLANALAQRRGELTTRMALLRSETHADIMAALDEDQQARLTEMRAERVARMAERRQRLKDRPPHRRDAPGGGPHSDDSGATEDGIL